MIYLSGDDLALIADRVIGPHLIRDHGLLAAAAGRPQASAFGEDAYPTIAEKAAALLHSVAMNHALVDGNKRLSLAATIAFLGVNGWRLTLSNNQAYQLIIAVASGEQRSVPAIAELIAANLQERR